MKTAFIVACHNIEKHSYIFNCVDSILASNPGHDIIVVDSDSPDKSYFEPIRAKGVTVLDAKNVHYDFGAYWIGFNYATSSDFFVFTHDSTVWHNPLDTKEFSTRPTTPFCWFPDTRHSKTEPYRQWAIDQMSKHCNYSVKEPNKSTEVLLAWGIFSARRDYMEKLKKDNFHLCLPSKKLEAMYAGEYLWARALENNGMDLKSLTYYGDYSGYYSSTPKTRIVTKFSGCIEHGRDPQVY